MLCPGRAARGQDRRGVGLGLGGQAVGVTCLVRVVHALDARAALWGHGGVQHRTGRLGTLCGHEINDSVNLNVMRRRRTMVVMVMMVMTIMMTKKKKKKQKKKKKKKKKKSEYWKKKKKKSE